MPPVRLEVRARTGLFRRRHLHQLRRHRGRRSARVSSFTTREACGWCSIIFLIRPKISTVCRHGILLTTDELTTSLSYSLIAAVAWETSAAARFKLEWSPLPEHEELR